MASAAPVKVVPGARAACVGGASPSGTAPSAAAAPRIVSVSPSTVASAPIGARQPPPLARRKARSASTAARVAGSSSRATSGRAIGSSARTSTASDPWPGAGSATSAGRTSLIRPSRPSRVSPATARTSASASPAASLRRRVSTLPWSGSRAQVRAGAPGGRRRGAGCRCRPRAPAGRVARVRPASRQTSASRGSSRGGYAAIARRGSSAVGTSFALWTARSIRPSSSAASRAITNAPSPQAVFGGRSSPAVRITTSSTVAPSARRSSAIIPDWASARALPRVPRRSDGPPVGVTAQTPKRSRAARSSEPASSSWRAARGAWRRAATSRWLICSTTARSSSARSGSRWRSHSTSALPERLGAVGHGLDDGHGVAGPEPLAVLAARLGDELLEAATEPVLGLELGGDGQVVDGGEARPERGLELLRDRRRRREVDDLRRRGRQRGGVDRARLPRPGEGDDRAGDRGEDAVDAERDGMAAHLGGERPAPARRSGS